MTFPNVTFDAWRAQVEKELAGKSFEKALVHETIEGIAIAPLYTQPTELPRVLSDGAPFRICMRHGADAREAEIIDDLEGGADALWLPRAAAKSVPTKLPAHASVIVDEDEATCSIGDEKAALVSTLDAHLRGADACDEIAIALSTTVARLASDPRSLLVRVAAGRDTFVELCKLRALRLNLRKVLKAADRSSVALSIQAVASQRTMATRDPWVNMLRVSTQLFAAILGGADLVTPLPFDDALTSPSALGRRLARNTGHVLREESALGRVVDPGAGSYYLDALTDSLARASWERFRAIEKEGGVTTALENGSIEARLAKTRATRSERIAKRKTALLGVSEFANLGEKLPSTARHEAMDELRDGARFEALRARVEALPKVESEIVVRTIGTFAESRARVSFATTFFAAGGFRVRELGEGEHAPPGSIACLCGTDDGYASEGAAAAKALRSNGAKHVMLAGRPSAIEKELREAGVNGFLFLGADVIATLSALVGGAS